jgi:hypothetical protein
MTDHMITMGIIYRHLCRTDADVALVDTSR